VSKGWSAAYHPLTAKRGYHDRLLVCCFTAHHRAPLSRRVTEQV